MWEVLFNLHDSERASVRVCFYICGLAGRGRHVVQSSKLLADCAELEVLEGDGDGNEKSSKRLMAGLAGCGVVVEKAAKGSAVVGVAVELLLKSPKSKVAN